MYTYIHACMHACIHYIHYIHYIHTYITLDYITLHTYINTIDIHVCIHNTHIYIYLHGRTRIFALGLFVDFGISPCSNFATFTAFCVLSENESSISLWF